MSFHLWLTILLCLSLGLSGCMKAIEKVAVPVPTPVETKEPNELNGPYGSDILRDSQDPMRGVGTADWTIPERLLADAGRFESEGEEEKALQSLERAAEAFVGQQDFSGEALVFCRKVLLLMTTGREREALDLTRAGGERWTAPPLRAFPEYLEGRLALQQGEFDRARELLQRSVRDNADFQADVHLLQLRRDAELAFGMAAVLSDHMPRLLAGYGLQESPESEKSEAGENDARLREVLALNEELQRTKVGSFIPACDFQRVEAEAYAFLGLEEGMRGNGEEAFLHLARAVELSRVAGFREGEIRTLLFMGELGFSGNNGAEGVRAVETLREKADLCRVTAYRIWARLLVARYEREQGRVGEAIAALAEADDILLNHMPGADPDMLARVSRRQRRAVYEFLVEMLAGEGRAEEAFTAAEKAKALKALDLPAGRDIGGSPAGRELLQSQSEIAETLRVLQRRILHVSGGARIDELLEKITGAEDAYRDLRVRIAAEDPNLLSRLCVRGIDPVALQALLDDNTTLFDYFTTDRSLYVWVIHREMLHLEQIEIKREALRNLVFSFLDAIRDKDKRKTESQARKAYDQLLQPVIPFVYGERIGFIPDDCLSYFPFAAMNYRGKYLAEGFSIFYLPRAGLFEGVPAETGSSDLRILTVGNPELEYERPDLQRAADELELRGFSALQQAFLHAQSPSIVSTLWLVDDGAASRLLDLFSRQLARKESAADALRVTQLQMLRGGFPPHVWAAFVLTGRY